MSASTYRVPSSMTAIEIKQPGGPEVLVPTTRPVPMPAADQVLIRIHAAAVNGPDVFQRKGLYDPPPGASELRRVGANGNHLTCHFQPWNVRSAGGRIVEPFALENVWTVHGSRVDADQNLIGGRHRHRARGRHQDLRTAGLFNLNGRHGRWHTIS